MNKSLLSIMAAVGLVAATGVAAADSSNVEIYGTLNADFENMKATGGNQTVALPAGQTLGTANAVGAAQPSRNKVTSSSSNIGFRGKEDIGMGVDVWFQVESGFGVDSTSSSNTWASRNTALGLASKKYGTIFYGQWDLPVKYYANSIDAWYATTDAASNAILGTPGFAVATTTQGGRVGGAGGTANAPDASFDRRQGNSVQYWTPDFYGVTARFAYSANEQRSSEPETAANPNISPTIYSTGVQYQRGPLRVMYTFEQHRDYFGLAAIAGATATPVGGLNDTSRDNENKGIVSYKFFDTTTVSGAWERLSYNNSDTVTGHVINFSRDAFYFTLLHQMGPATLRAGYGNAHNGSCKIGGGAACSAVDTGAQNFTFGGSYSFSKRTDIYAFYARMNNATFASYSLGNGNVPATAPVPGGSHVQAIALGLRHSF